MSALAKLIDALARPGARHVIVMHDHDCPALVSEALTDCRCDPVLIAGEEGETFEHLRQRVLKGGGVA
jgi:hypothetical protein